MTQLVPLDFLMEHHLPAIGAFDPQVLWGLALEQGLDLGAHDLRDPVHGFNHRRLTILEGRGLG